jgi:acyl-CoA reductase-like NAD-dependent aldehyde dehydrogenase
MTGAREDASAAVEAAEQAFARWSSKPPGERTKLLERAAELLTI